MLTNRIEVLWNQSKKYIQWVNYTQRKHKYNSISEPTFMYVAKLRDGNLLTKQLVNNWHCIIQSAHSIYLGLFVKLEAPVTFSGLLVASASVGTFGSSIGGLCSGLLLNDFVGCINPLPGLPHCTTIRVVAGLLSLLGGITALCSLTHSGQKNRRVT